MSNPYEYRLEQIKMLIHAYTDKDEESFKEEVEALKTERNQILDKLNRE